MEIGGDFMTAVNEVVWRCFFKIMHPITDNTGLCILMFAAATAILPVLLSWKRAEILVVLLSYLSVRDMLLHLSGIHPRINTMLGTSSEIISGSGRYLHALPGLNGKTLSGKGEVSAYLFSLSQKDMKRLVGTDPEMLYEKLISCMDKTRDLFGYVDKRPEGFLLTGIFLLTASVLLCRMIKGRTLEGVFYLLLLFSSHMAGEVWFLSAFLFSKILFSISFSGLREYTILAKKRRLPNEKKIIQEAGH